MLALAELREITGGDEDLLAELLSDLKDGLRKSLDLLSAAQSDEDWKLYAHRLKGGALSIGAKRIADLAAQTEDAGHRDELVLERLEILFEQDVNLT